MTKKQFLKEMQDIKKMLHESKRYHLGVCVFLTNYYMWKKWIQIMSPYLYGQGIGYWMADATDKVPPADVLEANRRRMLGICFFEEFCLSEKLYKQF
jgi:hypothetical protein